MCIKYYANQKKCMFSFASGNRKRHGRAIMGLRLKSAEGLTEGESTQVCSPGTQLVQRLKSGKVVFFGDETKR